MDTNLSAIEKDSGHLYRVSEIPNWQFTFYVVLTYIVGSPDGEELKTKSNLWIILTTFKDSLLPRKAAVGGVMPLMRMLYQKFEMAEK